MNDHTPHLIDDVLTWTKTVTIDLPLAGAEWASGVGTEETVTVAAWQGYDASIRALTAVVDLLYRMPLTGTVVDQTTQSFFRWQQVSNAITSAVSSSLCHTLGVPTTTDLLALDETLTQLTTEVRKQRDAQAVLLHLMMQLPHAPEPAEQTVTSESNTSRYPSSQQRAALAMLRRTHQKGN